jgi:hypothetical protein
LNNVGEHSESGLHLKNIKVHRGPHLTLQTTILQHTFRFAEVEDCFQSFRMVCKTWKNSVETIKFNHMLGPKFFCDLYIRLQAHPNQAL